ncbi:LysR family transcriptional regulator [Georgenia ruanii]|uniref:LysR family transcriptional regulator n=1 Tax=Georgenia ruanii TaxID=348442 RepID=A0A7J9UY04_9MICO|nr:LysR family transcriptional regulator [Georgenia ruanii]MPV89518.1 LysR family transcriptional regulator [Georgenia ruanii]
MSQKLANVDLNVLVALDALLAERSVTRAAERLMIGQSAMSSTLARLRRIFDDPLLVRQGRTLQPTPLAESLAAPVREALAIVEAVLAVRTDFDPTTDHRTFTISASDYIALVLLRPLLERLRETAPNVRVNIVPINPDGFTDALRRNETDLLILPRELLGANVGYPHTALFSDRYLVAVDRDHPEVADEITVEQFSTLPYLAYRAGTLIGLPENQLEQQQIPRNLEVTAQSFVVAPFLLRGTGLIMLIHEHLGRLLAEQANLRLLEPPMPLVPLQETMIWTSRHTADVAHQWLRARLLELAGEIAAGASY